MGQVFGLRNDAVYQILKWAQNSKIPDQRHLTSCRFIDLLVYYDKDILLLDFSRKGYDFSESGSQY